MLTFRDEQVTVRNTALPSISCGGENKIEWDKGPVPVSQKKEALSINWKKEELLINCIAVL